MSSTITTGKLAAAFRRNSDRLFYVLFERVHESNVYPHDPSWQCSFIGTAQAAVRTIFYWASSCEGGMLKGRDGHIKPENYIAAWLRELANPVVMPDRDIRLYAGEGWSAPLPLNNADFLGRIDALCREDIAEIIRAGKVAELTLHTHTDLLVAIYGEESHEHLHIPPWRILKGHDRPHDVTRDRTLGYAPKPARCHPAHVPDAIRIGQYDHVLRQPDGAWVNEGWAYSIIGQHIRTLADLELAEPGHYRRAIPCFRHAIENAPLPPEGTIALLDRSACPAKRDIEQFDHALQRAALAAPGGYLTLPWSVATGDILSYFPKVAVTWNIPQKATDCEREKSKMNLQG